MRDRLRKRLPKATEVEVEHIAQILERYEIEPKVTMIDAYGFIFTDTKGRTARVVEASYRGKSAYIADPHAEIAIVIIAGINAGWIESAKLEDLEDRFLIKTKALSPMPDTFTFDQYCAHLSEHGGVSLNNEWTCFGCGRKLIFNE